MASLILILIARAPLLGNVSGTPDAETRQLDTASACW